MSARHLLPRPAQVAAIAWAISAIAFDHATAEDAGWVVSELTGGATVEFADGATVMAAPDLQVAPGARVTTDDSGRLTLTHSDTAMTLSPATEIEIRQPPTDDQTSIFQRVGMLLLKVERRTHKYFEVETPYLAAVVKGTRFTVSVADTGAAVHVTEGAVEVSTPQVAAPMLVHPGQTATIDAGALDRLRLEGGQSLNAPPDHSAAAANRQDRGGHGQKQVIRRAIGDTEIDILAATDGLVGSRANARAHHAATKKGAAGENGKDASQDRSSNGLAIGLVANKADPSAAGANGVGKGKALGKGLGNGNGLANGLGNGNGNRLGLGLGNTGQGAANAAAIAANSAVNSLDKLPKIKKKP